VFFVYVMYNIFKNVIHYFVLFGGMPTNTSINKKWNQIDNHQPHNYMQLNERCTNIKYYYMMQKYYIVYQPFLYYISTYLRFIVLV
jgi:hypothetical protein